MAFQFVLGAALAAQVAAAVLALRLNHRYRIQRAWLFISSAAILMGVLRFTSLMDIWDRPPDVHRDAVLWAMTLAALLISLLMLGGMALIEPFFIQIEKAQRLLRDRNRELESAAQATEEEMRLAKSIQQNLLPKAAPDVPNLDVAGASESAEWTSGDFFDYFQLAGGDLGILIADASGHGMGPAILMSTARAFLRAFADECSDPGQLLTRVNRALANDIHDHRFVTAFLVALDFDRREARCVGAGHSGWLIKSDGAAHELSADYPPLGVLKDCRMQSQPLPLEPGDIPLLVTDGIVESENSLGAMLGHEQVLDVVAERRHLSSSQIVSHIFRLAQDFTDGPQRDDNTAVVIKVP